MIQKKSIIERYKNNNIVRHSVELFFTQGFASVIALLNTSIMAKGLGIEGVGIVGAIVAYATFFDGLVNFQSYNSVIKYGSEAQAEGDTDRLLNYFALAFFQDIITAVAAFILGYSFLGIVAQWLKWDKRVTQLAAIYLISIPMNINGSTNGVLRLNDKFTYTGIISIITNVIKTICLFYAMASGLSLEMYINIELVRIFLYNTIVFFISNRINIKKYGKSPYSFHIKFDKEFTTYNIYNNLRTTIDMPTGQVVNLLINKYLGFEAVGIYSILTKLGSVVAKVTSPISQSMLPELSRMIATRKRDIAWKLSEKMFIYINIAGLICTGVLSLFYKIWMPFFMEANIQNNIYFALYLVYLTFTSASVGIHSFFFADNYVKENLYICLGCNAIYLVLLFMTISKYGLYSVILCLLLQAIMVIVCKFLIYNKC